MLIAHLFREWQDIYQFFNERITNEVSVLARDLTTYLHLSLGGANAKYRSM